MKLRKGVNRGREKGEFGATIVDIEVLDIEEGKKRSSKLLKVDDGY